jgi:hypothetical protein
MDGWYSLFERQSPMMAMDRIREPVMDRAAVLTFPVDCAIILVPIRHRTTRILLRAFTVLQLQGHNLKGSVP